jgi:1-acyl-sn-glycerol-3-phosphate acyltransferase
LRGGDNVVLFPEGTTTRGDTVRRFHSRLLQPAISAGVPVQAVAIAYQGEQATTLIPFVGDDDFLPHLLRVLQLSRITVTVHFSEPLSVSDDLQRDALAKTARAQVLSALNLVD